MITKSLNINRLLSLILSVFVTAAMRAASWYPTHVTIQTGGGMGTPAIGTGWTYGSHDRWETDIFIGLIPRHEAASAKPVFTVKENFTPWKIHVWRSISVEPLTASFYITSILNGKFWFHQPDRYPSGYYIPSTKFRMNISIGQRISIRLPRRDHCPTTLTAFYEIGTCDIYLLNAVGNSYLRPNDYLFLTLGLRVGI